MKASIILLIILFLSSCGVKKPLILPTHDQNFSFENK